MTTLMSGLTTGTMTAPGGATEATSPVALLGPEPTEVLVPLRQGGTVALRPLRPGEAGPLQEIFDGMSAEARFQRYLAGMPRLPGAMLTALADVDGVRHAAWLASVAGRPVGVARYVVVEPGVAELAFEVTDAHRGTGIGTVLLDAITTVAAAHSVRRIRAALLPDNGPSRALVTKVGVRLFPARTILEGEGPLRLLDPPRIDRRAVIGLAASSPSWRNPVRVVG
jgi:RimJ/RimL family protein N-acetyltransferase